jgi:hypothetical protein
MAQSSGVRRGLCAGRTAPQFGFISVGNRSALTGVLGAVKRLALLVLPVLLTACSHATKGASPPPPASPKAQTSVGTPTAASPASPCATPVDAVAAAMIPHNVKVWAHGESVVGGGALWTIRSALGVPGTAYQHTWVVKFPWFTRPFGLPRIDARRVDGPGTFRSSVDRAVDQTGVWVASSLVFSTAGCWEVTSRFDDSVLHFRILVGHAP